MAALVTGCFAVLVALLERSRRQNSREHADTVSRLDRVLYRIGKLDAKLDRHLTDHEDGNA